MFARQGLSLDLPSGVLGIFVGLAFGFTIGLFYYQTYRKTYYWLYSMGSGVIAAALVPFILHNVLGMDGTTVHASIAQFGAAMVAVIFANHGLYFLNKRHKLKLRSSRRRTYSKDLAVAHAPHSRTPAL